MADFNKVLTPGDYEKGELNVVIEIPTGSNHKIEWDREHACFMLDRVEPMAFAKPCNYGFIPQTIDEDGDELDVLMITDQPLTTGIWMKAKILGVMKFVDGGEVGIYVVNGKNTIEALAIGLASGSVHGYFHATTSGHANLRFLVLYHSVNAEFFCSGF